MLGSKCSLCGERLNSHGICTECGLNHRRTSECEGRPLTHEHKEGPVYSAVEPSITRKEKSAGKAAPEKYVSVKQSKAARNLLTVLSIAAVVIA